MKPSILVITPVTDIPGVMETLKKAGSVTYWPDPSSRKVLGAVSRFDAIFTNPNKSNVYLSDAFLAKGGKLKVICTASTGTNHIDLAAAKKRGIRILSLTEERKVISAITSTAEHAFALTLAALRKVPQGWDAVRKGKWDWEPFVGRQLNRLTVGVVGYGRLGTLYADYAKAFGARVLVNDPYKKVSKRGLEQVSVAKLLKESDVISFHIHVTPETLRMIDGGWFAKMKKDVVLVNTSRGDILDEPALVRFLKKHPNAFYATDVLSEETKSKKKSAVLKEAARGAQIFVTPHVGGMTREGRQIAYGHAASLLRDFLKKKASR